MFLLFGWRAHLQNECGIVERISHPIDTETWRLVQSFSAASPRHQGRFHTGEDWYGGRGMSAGSPVRAIANGRVTYSSPSGWGRDGGVIIIEHTFPDGSIAYSQYGHLGEGGIDSFPPRLSCVEAGQIIGVVGDARPAP
ncbi:MAG: M23 family metallopeptidase, partial [Chloroflexi bacterium]